MKLPKYITIDVGPDGKERFYYRRPGQKKVRINGVPYTPSFMAEYEAASTGVVIRQPLVKKTGTFEWLCEQYYSSAEFKALDAVYTKPRRREYLQRVCGEGVKKDSALKFGNVPLSAWNKQAIRALRDRVADTPGTANNLLKALRAVFAFANEANHCETNPARDVKYLGGSVDGHYSWTKEDVTKFETMYKVGSRERLAMALMLYTMQRSSDILRLGPQHVKDGWLIFTQHKNRNRKPIHMEIPMRPELQEIIDASQTTANLFLANHNGEQYAPTHFATWFSDAAHDAGVPGSAHGLRKAAAARLAELGATDKEIMSMGGWTTLEQVAKYTKAANNRILAEMATARSAKGK